MAADAAEDDEWVLEVLRFWFEEVGRDGWFRKDEVLDDHIRQRFLSRYEALSKLPTVDAVLFDANTALAAVLVLDQFARNMFRDTPASFAADRFAVRIAGAAVSKGYDRKVAQDRRVFFYLPFEHSEDLSDQERSVELISALGDDEFTKYAVAHRDVIARFGRFPHRNSVLRRISSPDEQAYLNTPGSGF